ncbi:hypothetical protein [Paraburkholderia hospita]|uniref:hypothetical protein n=1 Tax=Paraburkholderia hospita TaxID=169430 RepID=UPI000271D7BB|nr:hypothetical protein [Paraburkholderia hospita]EUC18606.1 hypothetical protein PMI06_003231 [Burkholderia sp. BT03]
MLLHRKRRSCQNAVHYAKASNLQLGDALTQAQIDTLSPPMLWYVEQSVPDPSWVSTGWVACPTITALMPQVYLPQNWSALPADRTITKSGLCCIIDSGRSHTELS